MEHSEYSDSVFSRDFYTVENSERLRESDSGVQIVPASGSPSELIAHQMGLSLAGSSRLKDEPIHSIAGTTEHGTALHLRSCALAQIRTVRATARVYSDNRC